MGKTKDLTGIMFDDLTVIKFIERVRKSYGNITLWECECLCGKIVIKSNKTLSNKNYNSCGCKNSLGEKRKGIKLFCGIGINDADYKLSEREILPNGTTRYTWRCPFYEAWSSMLKRCYSVHYKKNKGRDPNSTVCNEWLTFSSFKKWMEQQDWEGKVLDKDLILKGNKVYSPDTCCFVSNTINCFFTKCTEDLNPSFNEKCNKYVARISNPITKTEESLGYYSSKEEAISYWFERKSEIALILSKELGLHQDVKNMLKDRNKLCQYLNIQCLL